MTRKEAIVRNKSIWRSVRRGTSLLWLARRYRLTPHKVGNIYMTREKTFCAKHGEQFSAADINRELSDFLYGPFFEGREFPLSKLTKRERNAAVRRASI